MGRECDCWSSGSRLAGNGAAGFPSLCRADECDMYAFTGSPAAWVIGHREARVVVDRQGRALHKLWNVEP